MMHVTQREMKTKRLRWPKKLSKKERNGKQNIQYYTCSGQLKNSTLITVATSLISLFQPSKLSWFRGNPSIRNRSFPLLSIACKFNINKLHLHFCLFLDICCKLTIVLHFKITSWHFLFNNFIKVHTRFNKEQVIWTGTMVPFFICVSISSPNWDPVRCLSSLRRSPADKWT